MFHKIISFLKEVQREAKAVNWPTARQTLKSTLIVIVFSLGIAALLGLFDFIFTNIIRKVVA